ncbi:WavE lipopolysaccharide synthesis family protein [uncultured Mailhella sp.]|uniref:WavE lipopolysaccharide synthesis family protein n=1 Tax=uncultured Mailhella sp. TaxID=1981031 RepID=UPI00320B4F5A
MAQRPLDKDISVVIQGALSAHTPEVLRSVRRFLPASELILSTWKGADVDGLDADVVILNDDPGGCICTRSGIVQNLNRQLVSTREGIRRATRKFVLKLRSDTRLTGSGFLDFWTRFPQREKAFSLFSRRLLVCSFYTRPPFWKKQAYLYHPSDWTSFGLKEDMLLLWDVPPVKEPDFSQYFCREYPDGTWTRFFPEQYFLIACMAKLGVPAGIRSQRDYSEDLALRSQHILLNNFVILDYGKQFTISCAKYPSIYSDSKVQSYRNFLIFYKKYCDCFYPVSRKLVWRELLGIEDALDNIKFHVFRIRRHKNRIFEVLGQSLGILYYIAVVLFRTVIFLYRIIFF